ncbi:unnamed protein product [Allacma fusca]|uniref:Uncharacterized protein n=1 Tax=Allacma fusca TaxID=39272 RepID=A0A8J2KZB4_9HEXA|nr:unnamed protein product [Allacma fusca]
MPKKVVIRPPILKVPFRIMSQKRPTSKKSMGGGGTTRSGKCRQAFKDALEAGSLMSAQDRNALKPMIFKMMENKPKVEFKITNSAELDAGGVSNKSFERLFDQLQM